MSVALLVIRLLLAAVFGVAGVAKLLDRAGSRRALVDFGAPARLAGSLGVLLPAAELATAIALVPSASARWGALAALALLGSFTVAVTAALARGRRPDCHCFGGLHSSRAGWPTLFRNAALALLAGAVLWLGPHAGALTGTETLLIVGGAVAVAVIAAQAWLWYQLLRQNSLILVRLEDLERGGRTSSEAVLLVGSPAPAFDLPAAGGGRLTLAGLLARGSQVMLVFNDPQCGPCNALLPELARWQVEQRNKLTIALVSRGSVADNQARAAEHELAPVLLQSDREVAEAYGAGGTPAAVLIDENGLIASTPVLGAEAIRALVSEMEADPHMPAVAVESTNSLDRSRVAAGALLAGGAVLAGPASTATAAGTESASDRATSAIRAKLRAVDGKTKADTRALIRALQHVPKRSPTPSPPVKAALRRYAEHVHELSGTIGGEPASRARALVLASLHSFERALSTFERALGASDSHAASQLEAEARRQLGNARRTGHQARIALGCPRACSEIL